jgi:hypothetical protein
MGEVLTAEALTVAALRTVRRASAATEDFMAEAVGSTAVAWPTVAAAASMAVEVAGSTAVEVVDTAAADTGNRGLIRSSLVR